jgi:hypothetical protein
VRPVQLLERGEVAALRPAHDVRRVTRISG